MTSPDCTSGRMNGPPPAAVAHRATAASATAYTDAAHAPYRTATHTMNRAGMRTSGYFRGNSPRSGPRHRTATPSPAASDRPSPTASPLRRRAFRVSGVNVSNGGANTSTPTASPTHQTSQASGNSGSRTEPSRASQTAPLVADSAIPPRAAAANRSGSRWEANDGSNRNRRSINTAATGARVLPAAMPTSAHSDTSPALIASTPRGMPSQYRRPKRHRTATAMPVGGQTRVTISPTWGNASPALPETK